MNDNSGILGPQDYCNSLNASLNYISANDLNTHLTTTKILSDQEQPDDFVQEFSQENRDFNRSLEFTPASSFFNPTQSIINSLNQNKTDYLNTLDQVLLNNPNKDHYIQQENTSTVNNAAIFVNAYEPGYLNTLDQVLLSDPNKDHYIQQENISTVNNTATSIDLYEPGFIDPVTSSLHGLDHNQTDYFSEPVLEDNWNFHPSSEFTLDSGFINPVTSRMFDVHHNQTGYMNAQGQEQYNSSNKDNYSQHTNLYADDDTVTSFYQHQLEGAVPSWNFNKNSKSTFSAGTFNPSTSNHFGIQSYQPEVKIPEHMSNTNNGPFSQASSTSEEFQKFLYNYHYNSFN